MNTWFYRFSDFVGSMNFFPRQIMANGNFRRRLSDSTIITDHGTKKTYLDKVSFQCHKQIGLSVCCKCCILSLSVCLACFSRKVLQPHLLHRQSGIFSATSNIIIHICRFFEGFQRKYQSKFPGYSPFNKPLLASWHFPCAGFIVFMTGKQIQNDKYGYGINELSDMGFIFRSGYCRKTFNHKMESNTFERRYISEMMVKSDSHN